MSASDKTHCLLLLLRRPLIYFLTQYRYKINGMCWLHHINWHSHHVTIYMFLTCLDVHFDVKNLKDVIRIDQSTSSFLSINKYRHVARHVHMTWFTITLCVARKQEHVEGKLHQR